MSRENRIARSRLHEIAKCLDVPIEAFLEGTVESELADLVEIQQLYFMLKTSDGRAAARDALHRILEREDRGVRMLITHEI